MRILPKQWGSTMKTSEIFTLNLPAFLRIPLEYLIGVTALRNVYKNAQLHASNLYEGIIQTMNTEIMTNRRELLKIPKNGPCIIIANHPYGCIEGIALMKTLVSLRNDVKIVANDILACVPEFHDSMIFVDPFENGTGLSLNVKALKLSIAHLRNGGMIVVFPAGEVSLFSLKKREVHDKEWHTTFFELALKTKSTIIPTFIHGSNSLFFQIVGNIHSKLKTALLLREFMIMRNKTLQISFGKPLGEKYLTDTNAIQLTKYVRDRVYLLKNKAKEVLADSDFSFTLGEEIVEQVCKKDLRANIEKIRDKLLYRHAELEVYHAEYHDIPHVMVEIGRLRELSFRLVGEGTGNPIDIDKYDTYYVHIFIWDNNAEEIVGAYRIGKTHEIVMNQGVQGLYTSDLFYLDSRFIKTMTNSIELGRSFVHPEYQKSYLPMLLLWKGIASYIVRNPRYRYLFGAVSISKDFSEFTRALILYYLERKHALSHDVHIRGKNSKEIYFLLLKYSQELRCYEVKTIDELQDLVTDLEIDGKGIPPLIKHYVKLGGKFAAFSTDPSFNNCIDGLVVVDLLDTETTLLSKYMSEHLDIYYSYHRYHTPTL